MSGGRLAASLAVSLAVMAGLVPAIPVAAHEQWASGATVPPWVKSACCGPEDVHHLTHAQVRALADGWHVEGLDHVLPYGHELPSQDGDYWIFYRRYPDGSQSAVYCFFAPAQGF